MHAVVNALRAALAAGASHEVRGVRGLASAWLAARLLLRAEAAEPPLVLLAAEERRAAELAEQIGVLSGQRERIWYFPAEQHLPYEEISPDVQAGMERLWMLAALVERAPPRLLVTSLRGLQALTIPPEELGRRGELVAVGERCERDALARHLQRCGYEPVTLVEEPGAFAVRGAVVDLFPPGREQPLRLELFGDTVERLYAFEPATQRRLADLRELHVFPIREVVLDEQTIPRALQGLRRLAEQVALPERRAAALAADLEAGVHFFGAEALRPLLYERQATLWQYLAPFAPALVIEEPEAVIGALRDLSALAAREHRAALEAGKPHLPPHEHFAPEEQAAALCDPRVTPALRLVTMAVELPATWTEQAGAAGRPAPGDRPAPGAGVQSSTLAVDELSELRQALAARRVNVGLGEPLEPLLEQLARWRRGMAKVLFLASTEGRAERIRGLLAGRKLAPTPTRLAPLPALDQLGRGGGLGLALASLPLATRIDDEVLLADELLFGGAQRQAAKARAAGGMELADLRRLRDGDLIVHVEYGIGRYHGLTRLSIAGMLGDYLDLEYADGDRLYLPVMQLGLVHPYRGPELKLDKLGGLRWRRARQRVREATQELAARLLTAGAQRQLRPGHSFAPPGEALAAFEASFPYEETPDQRTAIDAVLAELAAPRPMDHLLVGDVGFGKTEVAMRAAFQVVHDGWQVGVLVPTTILALQHGETFRRRFAETAVRVEVVSRLRSPAEQRRVLADVAEGRVDILIGTHRLLSGDVRFKRLGLLVIDEEQRFGVKHKERLRELRAAVDVLTLTATPIPRTLYMSMVGLRSLSLIETPPPDRLAVKTTICRFDEAVLAEAIATELRRGGQVYLLHNRVASIDAMAELVRRLVPEARVAVGHGQLDERRLEAVMLDFIARATNVLVCSTIIENGLDIPSVNTLIVTEADQFGLAQLYQIRGRIGRGRQRAHAWFMLPAEREIGPEARQRLAALQQFSQLGAGVRIAHEDLELRGAGDLLGADQSGHVAAVGFELYTELLAQAVQELQGRPEQHAAPAEVKLPVQALLPDDYVTETGERIALYQRMSLARSQAELYALVDELRDRWGPAPAPVETLLGVFLIALDLRRLGAAALHGQARDGRAWLQLQLMAPEPGGAPAAAAAAAAGPQAGALTPERLVALCQRQPERLRLTPAGKLVYELAPTPEVDLDWIAAARSFLLDLLARDSTGPG